MYKVKWKNAEGKDCEKQADSLSLAMQLAKKLGVPVVINGDELDIIGVFGADGVTDGKLPSGDIYSWYKRRKPK